MGDAPESSRPAKTSTAPSPPPKVVKFWQMLVGMFGDRLTSQHGTQLPPSWTPVLATMTGPELKATLREILNSGSPHPPSLPEILEIAARSSGKKRSKFPEPHTPEWNAQRKDLMARIARESSDRGMVWSDSDRNASRIALTFAELSPGVIGFVEARAAYEALPNRGVAR